MDPEQRRIAESTYPTPSPTGHRAGQKVRASGGEAALQPLSAIYVGYDPACAHKPHVVNVFVPSGTLDLHVECVETVHDVVVLRLKPPRSHAEVCRHEHKRCGAYLRHLVDANPSQPERWKTLLRRLAEDLENGYASHSFPGFDETTGEYETPEPPRNNMDDLIKELTRLNCRTDDYRIEVKDLGDVVELSDASTGDVFTVNPAVLTDLLRQLPDDSPIEEGEDYSVWEVIITLAESGPGVCRKWLALRGAG